MTIKNLMPNIKNHLMKIKLGEIEKGKTVAIDANIYILKLTY